MTTVSPFEQPPVAPGEAMLEKLNVKEAPEADP
jgi:hypothetical protein